MNHTGDVSGRRFLEQDTKKNEIQRRPQQNQSFLFHDLKVVDSYFEVKKELEAQGAKVKSTINESHQFRASKLGKQNHERTQEQHVMDCLIELEEPMEINIGGKTTSAKTIAIEYGNYPTKRMREKLEGAKYDVAYVYSNKTHQARYQKLICIDRPIVFRSI